MKTIIVVFLSAVLSVGSGVAQGAVRVTSYVGEYLANTEADCDMRVILKESGIGVATQICVAEDGTHRISTVDFQLTWETEGDSIYIRYIGSVMQLSYHKSMSCDGSAGKVGEGLVLMTKGKSNILNGYGSRFWKKGGGCL